MFCPQCGKPVQDDDLVCKNCGVLLKKYDTPQAAMNDNTVHAEPKKGETIWEMFFSTKGRLNRKRYIKRLLVINVIGITITLIALFAYGGIHHVLMPRDLFHSLNYGIGFITLLPCAMLMVRRFHDFNRSGLWFFLIFLPYVCAVPLIAALFIKGTKGPNKYGPDPLQAEEKETK